MARITWDNVVAPDYRSSMMGFQNASELLSGAFGSARAGLKDFDTTRRERVNRVVAERMAKITTDEEMQAALRSGQLFQGINPDLLSAASYEAAMKRPASLLSNETTRENNAQTAWENGVARTDRANSIALAPHLAEFQAVMERGTPEQKAAAQSRLMQAGADLNMTSDQVLAAARAGDSLIRTDKEFRDSDQQFVENVYDFDTKREDRNESRFVEASIARLNEENLTVAEAAEALRGMDVPDHLKGRIARGLNVPGLLGVEDIAAYGTASPSGGSISEAVVSANKIGNSGAVFDKPQSEVATVLSNGGLSPEVVAGFMGNFHVEGGYDGARGDGGSADGIAQWRNERREAFRNKYGKDPSKATKAQQAEFVLWELTTPEGRKVAGISKANADKIMNASSAEEAARLIDQYYERSNGKHRDRRAAAATDFSTLFRTSQTQAERARAVEANEAQADPAFSNYFDNVGEYQDYSGEARAMLEDKDGDFAKSGISATALENMLRNMQARADAIAEENGFPKRSINAKQARAILEDSWGDDTIWNNFRNIFGAGNPSRGAWNEWDVAINDDKIDDQLTKILGGGVERQGNARDAVGFQTQDAEAIAQQIAKLEGLAAAAAARGQTERAAELMAEANLLKGGGAEVLAGQGIGGGRRSGLQTTGQPVLRTRIPRRPGSPEEERVRQIFRERLSR